MAGSPDQSGDILLGDDCALVFFFFFFFLFFRFVSASFFLFCFSQKFGSDLLNLLILHYLRSVFSRLYNMGSLQIHTRCVYFNYSMLPTTT